ncbi:copper-binding protein [Azospirillum soli]|uniref:copper-binding protein n=1 Tax=Azospirillum soli TaxID=1304799 RepID=UPI001AEAF2D6|nr:copper-binding protein [Azospirillum soli]MBP2311807.1 Cu/Ag efflux protein CusF [Azospirillum soli]
MRRTLTLIATTAIAAGIVGTAQAQMHNHGAAPVPAAKTAEPSAGTTGKVNSVDPHKHVINLTHGPIPALSWPAMTMDFGVAPTIDLGAIKPGDTVAFTVGKDAKGMYLIDSLKPAK